MFVSEEEDDQEEGLLLLPPKFVICRWLKEVEGDGDDDTSVDDDDTGFIKITSSDTPTAARTAAILKQVC